MNTISLIRKIPFFPSPGEQCGQACSIMMIKYYYPNFKPNLKEINRIIHFKPGKYTFPLQNAILLDNYGVKAKCLSSDDYPTLEEDPDIFKKWFGKEYPQVKKFIDFQAYNWTVKEGRKRKLFQKRKTSFDQIIEFFKKGWLVTLAIDWNTLKGKRGGYQGHFVLLSGVKKDKVLIHDPDEGPFIEYPRKILEKAYSHPAIANDVLIAMGKKH